MLNVSTEPSVSWGPESQTHFTLTACNKREKSKVTNVQMTVLPPRGCASIMGFSEQGAERPTPVKMDIPPARATTVGWLL